MPKSVWFFKTGEPNWAQGILKLDWMLKSPCKKSEEVCNLTRLFSLLVRTVNYPKPELGKDSLSIVQMGSQGSRMIADPGALFSLLSSKWKPCPHATPRNWSLLSHLSNGLQWRGLQWRQARQLTLILCMELQSIPHFTGEILLLLNVAL